MLHVPAGEGRVGEGRGANSSAGASAFPPAIDPNLLNLEIYRAVEAANKEWKPVANQDSWDSVDSDRQLALRLQTEEVPQLSMCPHTAVYVSSCCYICVLMLLCACVRVRHLAMRLQTEEFIHNRLTPRTMDASS